MGLFDLPAPVFASLDQLLVSLPSGVRLIAWAVVTGLVSMLLYWLCSSQAKIAAAKSAALSARTALNRYEGDQLSELWPLIGASLASSARHFAAVLGPALLGSVPALAIIVWVSNTFSVVPPEPGDRIAIVAQPATELVDQQGEQIPGYVEFPLRDDALLVRAVDSPTVLLSLPTDAPVPVVHQRRWWNTLIGNPAGYLPDSSTIEEIFIDYPRQEYLSIGPTWLRTWEAPFFLVLILSSLACKTIFRID